MTHKKRQGISLQMIGQITKFYKFLNKTNTATDIRNLRQIAISDYQRGPEGHPSLSVTTINCDLD